MKKVSIIIPVYNNEEYIEECLESIFKQTIVSDLEVICINDGSTDKSRNIIKQYGKKHKNIILIDQKNQGSGIARNVGIANACGEYMMFVDGDDYIPCEDCLEALYNAAIKNHVDLCAGNQLRLSKGRVIWYFETNRRGSCFYKEGVIKTDDFQYPYAHQRYLFKRSYLLGNEIKYPKNRRGQDVTFCAKAIATTENIYHINKPVYVHREQHKKVNFSWEKAVDYMGCLNDVFDISVRKRWNIMAGLMITEMRVFAIKYWYQMVDERNEWNKINESNKKIFEYINVSCDEKRIKPMLTAEEWKSRSLAYRIEWLRIMFYQTNKFAARMIGRILSKRYK